MAGNVPQRVKWPVLGAKRSKKHRQVWLDEIYKNPVFIYYTEKMSSCVEEDFIFGLDLGHHSLTHAHAIVGRGRGRHVRVQHVLCVHSRLLGLVLKEERVIGR